MPSISFENSGQYLDALERNPALALATLDMAQDICGVGRATVDKMLREDVLTCVEIAGVRHVLAADLRARMLRYRDQVTKVRLILEQLARKQTTTFYEPVMSPVGLSWRVPRDRTLVGQILGDISEQTHQEVAADGQSGVLLSVLVHKKTTGVTRPGEGFFNLAASLGYEWEDPDAFVQEQTTRVFAYYAA
jgi:hypothetical protein